MPTINLLVPEDMNKKRQKLNASWRDIITAGLDALDKNPPSKKVSSLNPAIEENLKLSVKHISEAWNLLKKHK